MRRLNLVTVLVVLAALALAACGGSSAPSKEDWQKDYAPMNQQIKVLGQQVGEAVSGAKGKTPTALATQFQGLADQATAAANDLSKIETPDDATIEQQQDDLVAALKQGANDLHAISAAASANDAKAASAAAAKLVADSAQIRKPRQALEQQLGATS